MDEREMAARCLAAAEERIQRGSPAGDDALAELNAACEWAISILRRDSPSGPADEWWRIRGDLQPGVRG